MSVENKVGRKTINDGNTPYSVRPSVRQSVLVLDYWHRVVVYHTQRKNKSGWLLKILQQNRPSTSSTCIYIHIRYHHEMRMLKVGPVVVGLKYSISCPIAMESEWNWNLLWVAGRVKDKWLMMTTTGTETLTVTATGGSLIGVTKQHLIFSLTTITPPHHHLYAAIITVVRF